MDATIGRGPVPKPSLPVRSDGAASRAGAAGGWRSGGATSFRSVLEREVGRPVPLRMSGHAAARLKAAGRTMTAGDMARLESAVEKAAAKGARDSLILMDDVAFVVSVANRTIITAVDSARMKESVFTQIDSAVIT